MKKVMSIAAFLFVSQLLSGCIAFIPPSYREPARETVVIIHEPDPVIIPQPIIIEVPAPTHPQPLPPEKPVVVKERKPKEKEPSDGRDQNSGRDAAERQRNSGERTRK
ncbi:MAG: hypothetical protein WCZ90_16540 [Melioribacteraceae bacterium]